MTKSTGIPPQIRLVNPFVRFDGERRTVEGYCYVTEDVGQGKAVVPREAMERMTEDYSRFANVREMHDTKRAVGTAKPNGPREDPDALGVWWDEKGAYMRAKIVDDDAWAKVVEGVYNGFSIGLKPKRMVRRGDRLYFVDGAWVETSIVDRPTDGESMFTLVRVEGPDEPAEDPLDLDALVEESFVQRVDAPGDDRALGAALQSAFLAIERLPHEIQRSEGYVALAASVRACLRASSPDETPQAQGGKPEGVQAEAPSAVGATPDTAPEDTGVARGESAVYDRVMEALDAVRGVAARLEALEAAVSRAQEADVRRASERPPAYRPHSPRPVGPGRVAPRPGVASDGGDAEAIRARIQALIAETKADDPPAVKQERLREHNALKARLAALESGAL